MFKKKPQKPQDGPSPKAVEWVGGLVSLSFPLPGRGGPSKPECLLWINEKGIGEGFDTGEPGEMLGKVGESLAAAIKRASESRRASPPQRLRVASPELAEALGRLQPEMEIVCAPTPELDPVLGALQMLPQLDGMLTELEARPKPKPGSKSPKIPLGLKLEVMHAAAKVHLADPLAVVPDYRHAISVMILHNSLPRGVQGGLLSFSADFEDEGCFTVRLVADRADFDAMVACMEEHERMDRELDEECERGDFDDGEWFDRPRLKMPPNVSLTFVPGKQPLSLSSGRPLDDDLELLKSGANMMFFVLDKGRPARDPTAEESTRMAVILLALSEFLKDRKSLKAAWQGGKAHKAQSAVETPDGQMMVMLSVP